MSGKISVKPEHLRAAAQAEDAIADEMKEPNRKAVSESKAAAGSFSGWTFSQALQQVADSWKPSLDGMEKRAKTGASNLRACADGHEWNDKASDQEFEKVGAQARSAPAVRPPAASGSTPFG